MIEGRNDAITASVGGEADVTVLYMPSCILQLPCQLRPCAAGHAYLCSGFGYLQHY